jgi:hypothetical protein
MTKPNTIDITETIATIQQAVRTWFTAGRTAAVGLHAIDTVENIAVQAMSAASRLRGVLMPFGIVQKDTASTASVAELLDSTVAAVKEAHGARQTGVTAQMSYAQAGDYIEAGRALDYLRSKLANCAIPGGMARL